MLDVKPKVVYKMKDVEIKTLNEFEIRLTQNLGRSR